MRILKIFVASIILSSCIRRDNFDIPDVSQQYDTLIRSKESNPSNIRIHIKGNVNGDYTLNSFLFFKGKIDTVFLIDQYSDSMKIKYRPNDVTDGYLKIEYVF